MEAKMATKYYCDGCDREMAAGHVKHVDVVVCADHSDSKIAKEYELCETCLSHLRDRCNPKNWVRSQPEHV